MKKNAITLAFLFAGMLFGAQAMAQGRIELNAAKSAQNCANVTDEGFTASFSFSSISATEEKKEKGVFSSITMDGTYPSGNLGEPSLPAANQLIAVPYGAQNVVAKVVSYSTTEYKLSDYNIGKIMPQQPSVRKDQKPEDIKFAYNEKAYASRNFTERGLVDFEIRGTMRGIQVGSLTINPVSYNPTKGSVVVYNDIVVEVSYGQYDKAAADSEFARTFSPYFANIYRTMFNWRDGVYDQHPDLWQAPVKMLVIANRMFEEIMQPWIEWKTMKGFYMNVNYTDEIGSTAAAIRSFIQDEYDKDAPTFVIIFGDKNQVPASATGSATQCVTDLQYMSVDNDDFPDIYHSRMCAESVQQMQNIIDKTLLYEKYAELPNPSYLNNVLLIAGWDSNWNPRVGKPTIQYAMNYYYNTEHGFENIHHWLGQPYTGCYAPMNTGVGFVNYTAHGSNTSWADPEFTVSDVNNLTNEGMPFLAMGNCCDAANWGINGTSFGEAMIRANTKAAYAYIGSCPSTYWYEDYYFAVGATNTFSQMPTYEQTAYGCYDAIWNDAEFNCVSAIPFIGNIAVCYAHANGYENSISSGATDKYYWQAYHTLGDGSVMPFRVQPTENNVSHLPTLPIGVNFFNVSADPGSYVAISKDGVLYGTGLIGESGNADITIDPITSGGDVTVCVTGLDKIPYISVIPAASLNSAYVTFDNVQCDQPLVTGAYVAPKVSLKNVGVQTANNVNVVLSTESEYIELLSATATIPSLAPEAIYEIANTFAFNVAVNIPHDTKVRFFLTCTSGSEVWESRFDLTFGAPNFAINSITNTELTPGNSATLTFDFLNNGGADAQDLVFEVYSSSSSLTLAANSFEIGNLNAGSTVSIPVELTVGSNVEVGSTFELPYLLSAGHYNLQGSYIVTVGNIIESFETGDFSMYNWQNTSNMPWTIVSSGANSGTYCAKSGAIGDNQQTNLILTTEIFADGEISFYRKVSSESDWDKLFFYIDNQEKGNWSGEKDWERVSFPVTTGTHTFKWSYQKDSSFGSGSDCAWVDDIQFPPTSVTLAIDPVTNLVANVNGYQVSLNWTAVAEASAYIIRRDGQEVANQSTTTFVESLSGGVYTYSVVATNGNGAFSAPATVTVNVCPVGIDENEADFSIYPNPANTVLNINCNSDYSYMLLNSMGQTVANGNGREMTQINVSDLAKGVYFLRLTSGTQVRIEKVVVK